MLGKDVRREVFDQRLCSADHPREAAEEPGAGEVGLPRSGCCWRSEAAA